jgi:hypothetical protein
MNMAMLRFYYGRRSTMMYQCQEPGSRCSCCFSDRRGGKTKICAGIVSFADLRLPNVDAVLDGQIAAAGARFRGIRLIAAHDRAIIGASSYVPPPGLMDDPNFRRGLKRLLVHNLTFEAWRGQRQRRQNSPPRLAWRIFLEWRCRDRLLD